MSNTAVTNENSKFNPNRLAKNIFIALILVSPPA